MASSPKKATAAAAAAAAAEVAVAPIETVAAEPAVVETAPVAVAPAPVPAAVVEAPKPFADAAKLFEAPAASITEMHGKVRSMIEKGLAESRTGYAKVKSAADETAVAVEASFATAKTGVLEINAKAFEALRASAEANFDFAKSAIAAKSVSDLVALQSEFARKQIERLTGQTKEIGALAQKVANDTVEPIKAQVAKTFKAAS